MNRQQFVNFFEVFTVYPQIIRIYNHIICGLTLKIQTCFGQRKKTAAFTTHN